MINVLITAGFALAILFFVVWVYIFIEVRKIIKRRQLIKLISTSEIFEDGVLISHSEISEYVNKKTLKGY